MKAKELKRKATGSLTAFLFSALALAALGGCIKDRPVELVDPQPKTFLLYDNIGGAAFENNVVAAGKAIAAGALIKGQRVVVYQRLSAGDRIYELVRKGNGYDRKLVKQYARGEMATLNPVDMRVVIADMRAATPGVEHFGMAFGSHGVGWLPSGSSVYVRRARSAPEGFEQLWRQRENPLTRYLASDTGVKIDLPVFADVMDDWAWDFFILDDCFMAGLEPIYDLRAIAKYIVASPTEIMIEGFPYDRVVGSLFGSQVDWTGAGLEEVLTHVASGFVAYYREGNVPDRPAATVAVVRTDQVPELARTVRTMNLEGLRTVDPKAGGVQYYETLAKHVFYDAEDYFALAAPTSALYQEFYTRLKQLVVYKDNTEQSYSAYGSPYWFTIKADGFSGMSVFIPWAETEPLRAAYEQTAWYKAVTL